jgi:hypothetical protein
MFNHLNHVREIVEPMIVEDDNFFLGRLYQVMKQLCPPWRINCNCFGGCLFNEHRLKTHWFGGQNMQCNFPTSISWLVESLTFSIWDKMDFKFYCSKSSLIWNSPRLGLKIWTNSFSWSRIGPMEPMLGVMDLLKPTCTFNFWKEILL